MTSHETLIARLIALAVGSLASSDETMMNEGRTAAYTAIKLAAKHGCRIDVAAGKVQANEPAPVPEARQEAPQAAPAPAPAPAPRAAYTGPRRAKANGYSAWRTITNRYAAKCCSCSADVAPGETVEWRKGVGVKCPSCSAAQSEVA